MLTHTHTHRIMQRRGKKRGYEAVEEAEKKLPLIGSYKRHVGEALIKYKAIDENTDGAFVAHAIEKAADALNEKDNFLTRRCVLLQRDATHKEMIEINKTLSRSHYQLLYQERGGYEREEYGRERWVIIKDYYVMPDDFDWRPTPLRSRLSRSPSLLR